ncbi:MAG: hypothetical protein ISS33_03515 [Candidatus Omnitrophica bacterium]|nr:hypothetical protein [Candidatus Omnitrophota bacterium]
MKNMGIKPPFYGVRTLSNIPPGDVFAWLDERALFNLSWGVKLKDNKEKERLLEEKFKPLLRDMKAEIVQNAWLDLKAVYGYFKYRVNAEELEILDENGARVEKIQFQRTEKGFGLIDSFEKSSELNNIVAFQAVTVGNRIRDAIQSLNDTGEATRAFLLHGLGVQMAEALAEYTHDTVRKELNLKKNGSRRYSPGFPLWKQLEDQTKLFKILDIEKRLDIHLTEAYQMVPEQSTTAMIIIG